MDFEEFKEELYEKFKKINIELNNVQIDQFYRYKNLLLEWNKKINLTSIIDDKEIILKHFVDCGTISKHISGNKNIIDVGTGAGFPGIPLKIINSEINLTLVDSLNKRVNFLKDVVNKLKLKNVEIVHSRAEELAQNDEYREKYDIAVSRAVAHLNILAEYTLPFVKKDGILIAMKSNNIKEELDESKKAIKILGGYIENIEKISLPESDIIRNNIIINKIEKTPKKYPRKPGTPTKEPIK